MSKQRIKSNKPFNPNEFKRLVETGFNTEMSNSDLLIDYLSTTIPSSGDLLQAFRESIVGQQYLSARLIETVENQLIAFTKRLECDISDHERDRIYDEIGQLFCIIVKERDKDREWNREILEICFTITLSIVGALLMRGITK